MDFEPENALDLPPTLIADGLDLTNCDREPIHVPGSIQPHGLLLALNAVDLTIGQASASVATLLGVRPQELLGQGLNAVLASADVGRAAALLGGGSAPGGIADRPVYLLSVRLRGGDRLFDAIAHRVDDLVVLELEPSLVETSHSAPELYRLVQTATMGLDRAGSLAEMCQAVADEIRRVNGFDRVMVYRFDAEWNGSVVAEAKRADLEPFLGLHYPAADIPRQARELYTRNWLRFIPDRDYEPSSVVPTLHPATGRPLDMSHSVLRSVSPIHVQYLRNMGVTASMSISLLRDGRLWGLVACHHYAGTRFVPYDVRTACELLGRVFSYQLTAKESAEVAAHVRRMDDVRERLLARVQLTEDVAALAEGSPSLLDLIGADGVAVVVGDAVVRAGQAPAAADVLALCGRIAAMTPQPEVYATDDLRALLGEGSGVLAPVAAGAMFVPLAAGRCQALVWFRAERARTVDWAGDPRKSVSKGEDSRLSPRGSFALWRDTVRGRSQPWTDGERAAARAFRQDLVGLLLQRSAELAEQNRTLRFTTAEREKLLEAERAARGEAERVGRMKDEFVATLSHELRTPLNAVLGWSQILRRTPGLSPDAAATVEVIERNARLQGRMIEDLLDVSRIVSGKIRLDLQPLALSDVASAAVDTVRPTAETKGVRLVALLDPLAGLSVTGDPSRLQQVFWNLLNNAVKFTPKGGRVQAVLERAGSHVEFSVSDTGTGIKPEFLPFVFDRFRQADASVARKTGGLGLGLAIVRHLVELHGGAVRAESPGEDRGSTFVVSLPLRMTRAREEFPHPTVPPAVPVQPDCERMHLDGVRVLVVDDEPDGRTLVVRVLEECGAHVTQAGSGAEGLAAIQVAAGREGEAGGVPFDVLVSDVGMPSEDGYTFARNLRRWESAENRPRLPAVALTAFARPEDRRQAMLAGFQVHIAKPVEAAELLAVVASLSGRI